MSFQPYDRNPSGIVFFGTNNSDSVYESNANFTIDGTTLRATNIKISDGGNIGSLSDTDAIAIAAGGNVTMSQDLTVTGDLTVNGTTTTISTTNSVVKDSLIELNNGATSNANDCGIVIERGSTGDNAIFAWDESADKFTLGTTTATGANTGDLTIVTGTLVADVEGDVTGDVTGDVSGNAGTATALASSRNFSIIGGVMAASDVAFDGTGDVDLTVTAASGLVMNQSTETSIADGDFLVFSDINDSHNLKKITKANLVSGLGGGGMSDFIITDGTTPQTIDDGETITFADGTGAEFVTSATNTVTVNSVDSEIDHDALSNMTANEHIDHTSVSITAGDGLTGGGTIASTKTLNVVGGTGITANADDIQISDGGVDTLQLAADAVDGTKIEDDAVNSEHIADGAVDEVHRTRTVATPTTTLNPIATDIVLANGTFTVTMPTGANGKVVVVKNIGTGVINIAATPNIDGSSGDHILYHKNETATLVYGSSQWNII